MIWQPRQNVARPDRYLVMAIGALLVIGLVMLMSASSVAAYDTYQDGFYFAKHQLLHIIIGLGVFFVLTKFDYRQLKTLAWPLLIVGLLLLLSVFIPGLAMGSRARSWINVFGFSLQPSEIIKFCFLIYLSALLAAENAARQRLLPFALAYGLIAILMLLQPDIGTLLIISLMAVAVYYVSGGSLKILTALAGIGLVGLTLMMLVFPYQQNRFRCWLNSDYSQRDICYQINQSLLAVGSGGFWGRGLGDSRQKFLYLPEVQNDFIFAIISEEVGFIFSAAIIVLYAIIFWRGWLVARRIKDEFGRNLAIGIITWIGLQAIINIGGVINFMPMTGLPLPLISYGGTAVLATLAALGVLVNLSKEN